MVSDILEKIASIIVTPIGLIVSMIVSLILLFILILPGISFFLRPEYPANATTGGPGRECVFFAPTGAPVPVSGSSGGYFGHLGWAVRVGQNDHWAFGSMEGTGDAFITAGKYNGAWTKQGNWDEVIKNFGGELLNRSTNHRYHGNGYFTQYRCRNTPHNNTQAVIQIANSLPSQGYRVTINDCIQSTIYLLTIYDSSLNVKPHPSTSTGTTAEQEAANAYYFDSITIPSLWFQTTLNDAHFEPIVSFSVEKCLVKYIPN